MTNGTRHLLILCSLSREESVFRLLRSLDATGIGQDLIVVFIESSQKLDYIKRVENFCREKFSNHSLGIQDPRGLPSCRNLGIATAESLWDPEHLVHFLDDDVTVPKDYFQLVTEFFQDNPQAHGGGPRISGLYKEYSTNWLSSIMGLTPHKNFGKLTKSGRNFWIVDDSNQESISVDWIPGCCMIFRPIVLQQFAFNAKLEKGPGQNYALGEDVDFTYKVSEAHLLKSIPSTFVNHHLEPSKRDNQDLMFRASAVWYAHLCNIAPSRVHSRLVKFCAFLEIMFLPSYSELMGLRINLVDLKKSRFRLKQFQKLFNEERIAKRLS